MKNDTTCRARPGSARRLGGAPGPQRAVCPPVLGPALCLAMILAHAGCGLLDGQAGEPAQRTSVGAWPSGDQPFAAIGAVVELAFAEDEVSLQALAADQGVVFPRDAEEEERLLAALREGPEEPTTLLGASGSASDEPPGAEPLELPPRSGNLPPDDGLGSVGFALGQVALALAIPVAALAPALLGPHGGSAAFLLMPGKAQSVDARVPVWSGAVGGAPFRVVTSAATLALFGSRLRAAHSERDAALATLLPEVFSKGPLGALVAAALAPLVTMAWGGNADVAAARAAAREGAEAAQDPSPQSCQAIENMAYAGGRAEWRRPEPLPAEQVVHVCVRRAGSVVASPRYLWVTPHMPVRFVNAADSSSSVQLTAHLLETASGAVGPFGSWTLVPGASVSVGELLTPEAVRAMPTNLHFALRSPTQGQVFALVSTSSGAVTFVTPIQVVER